VCVAGARDRESRRRREPLRACAGVRGAQGEVRAARGVASSGEPGGRKRASPRSHSSKDYGAREKAGRAVQRSTHAETCLYADRSKLKCLKYPIQDATCASAIEKRLPTRYSLPSSAWSRIFIRS